MSDKSSIYSVNSDGEAILRTSEKATGDPTSIYGVNSDGKACMRVSSDVTSDDPTSIYGVNGSGEACVRIEGSGGGGTTINNQDITVTENGTYTANEGYTGLGTVEVQVPNPSTGILSIVANGSYDVTEYATAEVNVPTGGGTATKFGASIDTFIGDVDENGTLLATAWTGALNFAGVKEIEDNVLANKFIGCTGITSVDLGSVMVVKSHGLSDAFSGCTGIATVNLGVLTTVETYGMHSTFYGCTGITSVGLGLLQSVQNGGAQSMFQGCSGIISVDLSSLSNISGATACQSMFYGCIGLRRVDLPSLTTVSAASALGSSAFNGMFAYCNGLTEIHFRADAQATIEALDGYANKFGAKNCTIYFDLIGTITVNGVAYSRSELNSIRVNGNKTFVAWKDASNNIVYTNATSEPAVDTPVYSDAGTTQVGTVSEVA